MIAEVALNLPLRRVFDYLLPAEEAERVVPGCRVVVPFGPRLRGGVVVKLKPGSDLPDARLKAIRSITESAPLFPEALLTFTRWVADYYHCGWGEVLEAAVPSGLGVRLRTLYRWREGGPAPEALVELSAAARTLVTAGEDWQGSAWERVTRGTPTDATSAAAAEAAQGAASASSDRRWLARQLRPGGAVEAVHEYAGTRRSLPTEHWVRLAVSAQEALAAVSLRRTAGAETRKQKVVRALTEEDVLPMARLKALVTSPGAIVRELAAEGLVLTEERVARQQGSEPLPPRTEFLELNAEQEAAYSAVREALSAGRYHSFLLEGVTGSGKTEVYLHAVREALAQDRGSLVLVPEIALTATMVNRFRERFGAEVEVLHSGIPDAQRFAAWSRVRNGRSRIVIGARSAVFAPVARLGLVVVDEEHDGSYKQDETPRYNGRDAALMRALQSNAVALLGSATPSMEALRNVGLGKHTGLHLSQRVESRPLPPVRMIDLRTAPRVVGAAFFSRPLIEALRGTLLRKEQAILFLNRRGFASLVRCGSCGEDILCENCSLTLTYHQSQQRLLCHRCDHSRPLPTHCPTCEAPELAVQGVGTERIEQEARKLFPRARVLRMDSDTLRRRGELERMMVAIEARRYDLIIGTQVLSKGHDFPHITLVGAVLADVSLNLPDFRAPERTFQVLTQMAGRAGRGDHPGEVLIQTYNPEHYSLQHALNHDSRAFAAHELALREAAAAPPFVSQALLWISAPKDAAAQAHAVELAGRLRGAAVPGLSILGPAEAPIRKLANRFRWMVLLRAGSPGPVHRALRGVLDDPAFKRPPSVRVAVDVDPYNVL